MMLTPRWPSAGPIGGAGLAVRAGPSSVIYAVILFCKSLKKLWQNCNLSELMFIG
jgi:hypothetical protein